MHKLFLNISILLLFIGYFNYKIQSSIGATQNFLRWSEAVLIWFINFLSDGWVSGREGY